MNRRDFIIRGLGGTMVTLVVGRTTQGCTSGSFAQSLDFTMTDALKDMVTHQDPALNPRANIAQCYFWMFKEATLPPGVPAPLVFASEGDTIPLRVTNALDEDHELAIPGIGFTTGRIAPGNTWNGRIGIPRGSAGTYLYFDSLNAPVNRVMGLHGALVVMPNPATGTPFSARDLVGAPNVVQLFADLGTKPWFPGLAWDEGAPNQAPFPDTPPLRQFVWLIHEASPNLFADVGDFPPGQDFPAEVFTDRFLNNSFVPDGVNKPPADMGDTPQYFTISGQSGHFSHNYPFNCPHLRVGEPCVIRVLNAGMWTHCLHIHANHVYVLNVRNEQTGRAAFSAFEDLDPAVVPGILNNQILIDTFASHPLDAWEWLVPYERPPDVPNSLGIGRPDLSFPLPVDPTPVPEFGAVMKNGELEKADTPPGVTTWPPIQELNMFIPKVGTKLGQTPIHEGLSPLCYPMHDHSEPSQTAQGGNYNQGLVSGINFIGDRNANGKLPPPPPGSNLSVSHGGVITFPMTPLTYNDPDFDNGDPAANQRAVFGPDFNLTPQPADGPVPPFEQSPQ